ncbi:hypothetical protein R6Z07F_018389 [Ovis aries]
MALAEELAPGGCLSGRGSATQLSPSGQADAKTLSVRLQEQLDAINEEIRLMEEEKENTEQQAEETESREGRGSLGSLCHYKSVSSLNLHAGSCPPLPKPRRRQHSPAREGDCLGIMTLEVLEKQSQEQSQMKERLAVLSAHVTELEEDLDTARKDLLKSEDVNVKLQRDV